MKSITTEQYRDILSNLYDLTPSEIKSFTDNKESLDQRLSGYTYDEIKKVVEEHCIETHGRILPVLGYILLMAEYKRPFKNPMPLDESFYTEFESLKDFVEKAKPYCKAWLDANEKIKTKIQNINSKRYAVMSGSERWQYNAERTETALELAKRVWEYRDTTFVKNSPVDPVLWLIQRHLVPDDTPDLFLLVGKTIGDIAANG